jgi:predicted phosphodiesterase
MKRLVFVVVLLSVTVAVGLGTPFVHGPYSGAPGVDSVTISWRSSPPLAGRVEYAPYAKWEITQTFDLVASVEAPNEGETTHVVLRGLHPGVRYAYQVVVADGEAEHRSQMGTFWTAPPPGSSISFAVLGDTQRQWTEPNRIALVGDAIASDPLPFQFILHAGDLVESPTGEYWDHWFASLAPMLLRAAFVPVLGNHERDHSSYYRTFSLPPGGGREGEQWWALHWGDAVVVGLDTNVRRPAVYTEQSAWIRAQLSGPEPHKFVIFHHPVFSSDAVYSPGTEGLQRLWHPLFVELGVDVVFTGHSHNYERIERDGVTYLVVGGGGGILRPLAEDRVEGSLIASADHHFYLRVTAEPNGIRVEVASVARQLNGDVVPVTGLLDAFVLPRL